MGQSDAANLRCLLKKMIFKGSSLSNYGYSLMLFSDNDDMELPRKRSARPQKGII
jgi:hypothetical protein